MAGNSVSVQTSTASGDAKTSLISGDKTVHFGAPKSIVEQIPYIVGGIIVLIIMLKRR